MSKPLIFATPTTIWIHSFLDDTFWVSHKFKRLILACYCRYRRFSEWGFYIKTDTTLLQFGCHMEGNLTIIPSSIGLPTAKAWITLLAFIRSTQILAHQHCNQNRQIKLTCNGDDDHRGFCKRWNRCDITISESCHGNKAEV